MAQMTLNCGRKIRGSNERYVLTKMEDIENEVDIPKFDHSVRWRRKDERPPRKSVSPTKTKPQIPSLGNNIVTRENNMTRHKNSKHEDNSKEKCQEKLV